MPRMPTELDLGERPTPTPTGAINPLNNGAEAQALQHLGQTMEGITDHLTHARRASQLADAIGRATEELGTKAIQYERDPEYATIPARFKQDATEIGRTHAETINDPVVRDLFVSQYHHYAVTKQLSVLHHAVQQEGDYNVGRLDATQEIMIHAYANAGNEAERAAIAKQYQMVVGAMKAERWIKDVDAEHRMRMFAMRADQAVALRDINEDPIAAAAKLADPGQYPRLDVVTRQQLVHSSEIRQRQQIARQHVADIAAEKQAREELFQKLAKRTLTVNDLMNSDASAPAKEHYLSMMKAQAKDDLERPIKQEPSAFLGVLAKIRSGEITNETQIEATYATSVERGRGINWADTVHLRKELTDLRSPEGERLSKVKDQFIHSVAPQIDKSNPLMNKMDLTGRQQLYEFSHEVDRRVDEYRQAGKNPHDLFNPAKPEFLGKPEVLKPFITTFQESTARAAEKLRAGAAGPVRPKLPMQPNESTADYLKRTGQ